MSYVKWKLTYIHPLALVVSKKMPFMVMTQGTIILNKIFWKGCVEKNPHTYSQTYKKTSPSEPVLFISCDGFALLSKKPVYSTANVTICYIVGF